MPVSAENAELVCKDSIMPNTRKIIDHGNSHTDQSKLMKSSAVLHETNRDKSHHLSAEKSRHVASSRKDTLTSAQHYDAESSRDSQRKVKDAAKADSHKSGVSTRRETLPSTHHQDTDSSRDSQRKSKDAAKADSHKSGAQTIREKLTSFSAYRPRGQTVSAYPVARRRPNEDEVKEKFMPFEKLLKSSLNPYYVFLQFFYSPFIRNSDSERPLLLGPGEVGVAITDLLPFSAMTVLRIQYHHCHTR